MNSRTQRREAGPFQNSLLIGLKQLPGDESPAMGHSARNEINFLSI